MKVCDTSEDAPIFLFKAEYNSWIQWWLRAQTYAATASA